MKRPHTHRQTNTHTHYVQSQSVSTFLSLIQYLGQIAAAVPCFGCWASCSSRDLWLWHPGVQRHVSPIRPLERVYSLSSRLSLSLCLFLSVLLFPFMSQCFSSFLALCFPSSLSFSVSLSHSWTFSRSLSLFFSTLMSFIPLSSLTYSFSSALHLLLPVQ